MEGKIDFVFRDRHYSANYLICQRQHPVYIFVFFNDDELVKEFGEEICIHSLGNKMLHDNVFSSKRRELYTAIFSQVMWYLPAEQPMNSIQQNNNT